MWKKYQEPKTEKYIVTDDGTIKVGDSIVATGVEILSLNKLLAREGLSTGDIKDVLDFIEFKKFKKKK